MQFILAQESDIFDGELLRTDSSPVNDALIRHSLVCAYLLHIVIDCITHGECLSPVFAQWTASSTASFCLSSYSAILQSIW